MARHDPPPVGRCRHAGGPCSDVSLADGGGELVLAQATGTLPRAPRQTETAESDNASGSCPALTPAGLARAPHGGPARHAHPVASSGLAAPLAAEVATRATPHSERMATTYREHGAGEPDLG